MNQSLNDLETAPLGRLKTIYEGLFPGRTAPSNRTHLWRRIAYKRQELEFGGLSDAAKKRLETLIADFDPVNNPALKSFSRPSPTSSRDKRLPLAGTVITKNYKGTKIQVRALDKGFEFNGKIYRSLSSIAKQITGAHWNGYLFFDL